MGLVRSASETYPYTSLYAFNGWSVFFDFWKPDTDLVFWGGVLLVAGLVLSVVPLWWRRDTAMLLACAILAALAFYFLPTRAHERYLFPVFALALPLAAARWRVLLPYVVLALAFALSLYYAFTRYQQYVDLRVPEIIETLIFGRAGQIGIALVMIGAAAYLIWRLVRGDARLESDGAWRALDSMSLYRHRPAASAIGALAAENALTRRFGVRWVPRRDGHGREIAGVSQALMDMFSSRRQSIGPMTARLAQAYEAQFGRAPDARALTSLSTTDAPQAARV